MNWRQAVVIALLVILLVFTAQNFEIVKIQFLFWSFNTSRALVVFVALFMGFVIGMAVSHRHRD